MSFRNSLNRFSRPLVGVGAVGLTGLASAAGTGIDTASAVATITDGNSAVAAIGAVILALAAVVAVYKWVTRSAR